MKNIEKFRNRNFRLELYPDDATHVKALEKIKNEYDYAAILHDKDVKEDGELKKPHYHVVLKFKNPRWNTALADDLGITENYIMKCDNFIKALQYLIHYNDLDKYQYSIEEVFGIFKKQLFKSIQNDGKDENQKASELFDFIEQYDDFLDIPTFGRYCQSVGMWDVFRRATMIFIKTIDRHNELLFQREEALEKYNGVFNRNIYQVDIDEFLK